MYNEGSAEFNALISKAGGNAPITRFTFSDFTIARFTKLEYYGGSNNSDNIAIGTTNMAYLDVSTITDKIVTNQEFLFEVGMELSDGTVEYSPMGYFTVQKPDGNEDTINFTAYDRMQKFEKSYFSTLTYPTDSAKVVNELCTICGVELATPITNPITITDKLEGYTCREVLGYIAGIHGYFACIDRYGKLNLRWYSETPIEKQIGLIWSLTKSQGNYRVEKIVLAKDNETTYTSGTGISGINYSNPYATQAIADSIYTSLGNFTYRPCEISMLDDIRLDSWDMIKVTYLDGSVLTIPVMSLSHGFTNGETKIKSVGKSDTENEYSYTGPVTQAMDRMATELLIANRVIATKVDAEYVQAHAITTDNISAIEAEIKNAVIEEVSAEYADIRLANIDTANIDVANIGLLFAKVGLIDRATIVDGHITGFLDVVEINANNITAGTLIADRILLKGSQNGLLYALNNLGELTSTTVDTLDGTILTQRTVTADKIVAESITANELDVTNIFGNSAVLSTLTSQEAFINAISTNSIVVGAYSKAQGIINNIYTPGTTTINGGKITTGSIKAAQIDVNNLFAQNITATGTITGATLIGTNAEIRKGKIGGFTIQDGKIGYLESANYVDLNTGILKTGYWNSFIINPETYTTVSEDNKKVMWFGAHPTINGSGVDENGYYKKDALFYPFYIDSSGLLVSQSDVMTEVMESGLDYSMNASANYTWVTTPYFEATYPILQLDKGGIKINNISFSASGFKYKDTDILSFNTNGIYSPKINAEKFACHESAEIEDLIVRNISFLSPVYISSYLSVAGAVRVNGTVVANMGMRSTNTSYFDTNTTTSCPCFFNTSTGECSNIWQGNGVNKFAVGLGTGEYNYDYFSWFSFARNCNLMALHQDGFLSMTNTSSSQGRVSIGVDGEGGNIELISPANTRGMQMDIYDNNIFRMYLFNVNPWEYVTNFGFDFAESVWFFNKMLRLTNGGLQLPNSESIFTQHTNGNYYKTLSCVNSGNVWFGSGYRDNSVSECYYAGNEVKFRTNGSYIYGNKNYSNDSDARLKHNVEDIDSKLIDVFDNLRPVTFVWNDSQDGRKMIGVIAQDVIGAFEKAGVDSEEFGVVMQQSPDEERDVGYYTVAYDNLHILTMAKVKAQDKSIKSLEKENAELKSKVDNLEARIAKLEGLIY